MRIESLEYLVDLEETQSITKTAEKFYVSRQVLSANIASLEQELGIPLLERYPNRVSLTSAGEMVIHKAKPMMDAYQELLHSISLFSDFTQPGQTQTVNLYAIPRLAVSLVPHILSKLKRSLPDVAFHMFTLTSKNLVKKVAQDPSGIGFISYTDKKDASMEAFNYFQFPNVVVHPFLEAQSCICLPKGSHYAKRKFFTTEDLSVLPIVTFAYSEKFIKSEPYAMNLVSSVNDLNALVSLVQQDVGLGLITYAEYNLLGKNNGLICKPLYNRGDHKLRFAYLLQNEQSENFVLYTLLQQILANGTIAEADESLL